MELHEDGSVNWEACRNNCVDSCVNNFDLVDNVASHLCGYEEYEYYEEDDEEKHQTDTMIMDAVGFSDEDDDKEEKINQSSNDAILEDWETAGMFICCCGSMTEPVSQIALAP